MLKKLFITLLAIGVFTNLHASNILQTKLTQKKYLKEVISVPEFDSYTEEKQKKITSVYSLKVDEYKQYLHFMNYSYDGVAYEANTNPNIILAIHAKSRDEYERYLENAVRADHEALDKMLRVSTDYTRKAKELYPNEKPVMTKQMRMGIKNWIHKRDIIQLYCKIDDPRCTKLIEFILPTIKNESDIRLDFFAVGQKDKISLFKFSKNQGITPELVSSNKVTLNLFDKVANQVLPKILVKRAGSQIPVTIEGLGL